MLVLGIDHIQIAIPADSDATARSFYKDLLGLVELLKPPHLAQRGGAWFQCGPLQLHLGVEKNFMPARKAHPGLLVDDLAALTGALLAGGFDVTTDEPIEGFDRIFTSDPFGNRLEFLERTDG